MGKGMLGIFVVTLVIILMIAILNFATKKRKSNIGAVASLICNGPVIFFKIILIFLKKGVDKYG